MIRMVEADDAQAICGIYNHYVENTTITFEEQALGAAEMADRIRELSASFPWLVIERNRELVGFAYASRWKSRSAYRYCVESTVYLAPEATGLGLGRQLYGELISMLRERAIHSVIGGIALPNPASIALHEKMGFEKVAHFREVGWKFNQWVDVGNWELVLRPANPSSPTPAG